MDPLPVREESAEDRGFLQALLGDGQPMLFTLALGLLASGGAALFLAITGQFLPHDEQFLGMTAAELCAFDACRVVHFMIHDRASFGGVLIAISLLYFWLLEFPFRRRDSRAWWTLLLSGAVGFTSFLAYLGYGYLDVWHAVATLALLPCYVVGLVRSRPLHAASVRCLRTTGSPPCWRSAPGVGQLCLLFTAAGVIGAGVTILTVGMTVVFVPQDLAFLGMAREELNALNPRLIPLIAHDRAGFGGALLSGGIALFLCVWCGKPSRSRWQVLALAGVAGFVPAIGVHPAIGYTDPVHLAPAVGGAVLYLIGLVLTFPGAELARRQRPSVIPA
jgi:hypothetical protein